MMDGTSREEEIFHAALELQSAEAREGYLREACGADIALRRRLEALLREGLPTRDFLEEPPLRPQNAQPAAPGGSSVGEASGPAERAGDRIGPYKLLERLGEGGCGVVYMAEQEAPMRRRVALKVVKLGMDTRDVVARFEAERQALALMDHPNIARVLDAGATATGRPYFVMELVRGIKITDYCDENELPTSARLELFVNVCQAIQHAHHKGVIHRDIKPSNVLVTLHDGRPVPKVIDFGIAKAIGQERLTDKTLFTSFRQFVGTPAYMSPEQAEMSGLDIDTRSDIYSLGVLLYELLTGQTPFEEKELLAAGLDEMRRTIREKQPLKPSTRLSTMLAGQLTAAAGRRRTEPARLINLLRGDLDWIVMKCLEKDRNRRYATANGVAADVQRHLHLEPVLARPPSRVYAFRKMVSRHKATFAAVAAVAMALVVGLGVSTHLYLDEIKVQQAASRDAEHAWLAEANAKEKLRNAYLAEAQAGRWSQRPGRRFQGLELLKKAAAIHPSVELRNEAIACMAVADLRTIKEWDACPPDASFLNVDADYRRYCFGDSQGVVHVRRVEDQTEVARFEGYEPPFSSLEFSRDGKLLFIASGSQHDREELWQLEPKKLLVRLGRPMFRAFSFSAGDKYLAIAYDQSSEGIPVRIYTVPEGTEVASFKHQTLPYYLRFHPSDPHLLLVSDETPEVRVWNWKEGRVMRSITHPGWVQGIEWHPSGTALATACEDGNVRLWDAATGKLLSEFAHHLAEAVNVTFRADGAMIASRGWDGMMQLWDVASRRQIVEREAPSALYPFSRPGNRLLVGLQPGRLGVLEADSGYGQRVLGSDLVGEEKTLSCAFSPDGAWLLSTHEKAIRLWEVTSGKKAAEISRESWEHFAVFHPDGKRFFLGTRQGVQEWSIGPHSPNLFADAERHLCGAVPQAYILSLSEDGRKLAVPASSELQILDTSERRKLAPLQPGYGPVFGALSPNGNLAVTWPRRSSQAEVWDVEAAAVAQKLPVQGCNHANFSPDNRLLVVGNAAEFRVLNVESWQTRYILPCSSAAFFGLSAFSPDGKVLATATSRKVVRLSDTASGRELATLETPEREVLSWLAFSPDGTRLAMALANGPIQLWDLRQVRGQLASMHLDWDMPLYPEIAAPLARTGK